MDVAEVHQAQLAHISREMVAGEGDGLRFQHEGLGKGIGQDDDQHDEGEDAHQAAAADAAAVAGTIGHGGLLIRSAEASGER